MISCWNSINTSLTHFKLPLKPYITADTVSFLYVQHPIQIHYFKNNSINVIWLYRRIYVVYRQYKRTDTNVLHHSRYSDMPPVQQPLANNFSFHFQASLCSILHGKLLEISFHDDFLARILRLWWRLKYLRLFPPFLSLSLPLSLTHSLSLSLSLSSISQHFLFQSHFEIYEG